MAYLLIERNGMINVIEMNGCTDCVMYLANGDVEEPANGWSPEAIERNWPGYHVVVAGDENTEAHFSWQACAVCGSTLGGNRYPCAAWKCEGTK